MASKDPLRGRTIIVPVWWTRMAETKKRDLGKINQEIADEVSVLLRRDSLPEALRLGPGDVIDQSRISRCLTGDTSPMHLLDAVCRVLKIPPPYFLARSEREAREMHSISASYGDAMDEEVGAMLADADAVVDGLDDEAHAALAGRHTEIVDSPGEAPGGHKARGNRGGVGRSR